MKNYVIEMLEQSFLRLVLACIICLPIMAIIANGFSLLHVAIAAIGWFVGEEISEMTS